MPRWTPRSLREAVTRVLYSDEALSYEFVDKGDDTVCLRIPIKVEYSRQEFSKLQIELDKVVTPRQYGSLKDFTETLSNKPVSINDNRVIMSLISLMEKTPYRHIVNIKEDEEDAFHDFLRREITRRGLCGHLREDPDQHICHKILNTLAKITAKNRVEAGGRELRVRLKSSDPRTRYNRPMKKLDEYFPAYKERIEISAKNQILQDVFPGMKDHMFDAITVVPIDEKQMDGIKEQIIRGKAFHEAGDELLNQSDIPLFRVYTHIEANFGKPSSTSPTGFFHYLSLLPKEEIIDPKRLVKGKPFRYYKIDLGFSIERVFDLIKQNTRNVILDTSIAEVLDAKIENIGYSNRQIFVSLN